MNCTRLYSRVLSVALVASGASGCSFFNAEEGEEERGAISEQSHSTGGSLASGGSPAIAEAPGGATAIDVPEEPPPSPEPVEVEPTGMEPVDPELEELRAQLARYLRINEVYVNANRSVLELYNSGSDTIDLSNIYVSSDLNDTTDACRLEGALLPGHYSVATESEFYCDFAEVCTFDCQFVFDFEGHAALFHAESPDAELELLASVELPEEGGLIVHSYQAVPDGGMYYFQLERSFGSTNGEPWW